MQNSWLGPFISCRNMFDSAGRTVEGVGAFASAGTVIPVLPHRSLICRTKRSYREVALQLFQCPSCSIQIPTGQNA